MTDRERLVPQDNEDRSNGSNGTRKRKSSNKAKINVDFVLAAKNIPEGLMNDREKEKNKRRRKYFHMLKKKRLKISRRHVSHDLKTAFWHVYAPFEVLADTAEDLNLKLPTVQIDIEVNPWYEILLKNFTHWLRKKDPFAVEDSYFPPRPSYFSDTFDKNRLKEFYPVNVGGDKEKIFSQTERSRLVSYILESTSVGDSDEKIGKGCLLDLGVLTAAYPCHDGPLLDDRQQTPSNDRQKLQKDWASFRKMFKYQPLQGICDYFGVKIAFYYAWIGFYTTWLVPASFLGILCCCFGCLSILWSTQIQDICNESEQFFMCPLCDKLCTYTLLHKSSCFYSKLTHCFDNAATPFFAVFMSIWSVFYLEFWKREQWSLAYEWHTIDFHEEEVVRPQYTASAKKFKKNPVTGKIEPFNSKKDQWLKIAGEASVVLFFISLVIGSLIGVIVYRAVIFAVLLATGSTFRKNSKMIVTGTAATINLIVINILKLIYKKLALMMTDWENPRTRSLYEKSFTVKMFWFQFCNTFASVFYVAFFKSEAFVGSPGRYRRFGTKHSRFEGCSEQGCFLELCVQLVILMAGQQLVGNVVEIGWPWLQKKYKTWKHNVWAAEDVTVWEKDYQLAGQDELSLFWEYEEVVLQYGFVTMFVAAFPLAPLVALVTNLVEIRIDAINMVKTFRRPVADKSEGIGVWYDILVTLTTLAVLINGFVIALASEFIPKLVYSNSYSPDGYLTGYVEWSLSYFNVSDFTSKEKPDILPDATNVNQTFCRYPGFHESKPPYSYSEEHWYIMTVRLVFAFLFQWTVSATGRVLAWIIPDKPVALDLKMKREEYLAKEALKKYKQKIGELLGEDVYSSEHENQESDEDAKQKNREQQEQEKLSDDVPVNKDVYMTTFARASREENDDERRNYDNLSDNAPVNKDVHTNTFFNTTPGGFNENQNDGYNGNLPYDVPLNNNVYMTTFSKATPGTSVEEICLGLESPEYMGTEYLSQML